MFEMTVFDSLYDVKTDKTFSKDDWPDFKRFLQELSKLPYTKKVAPLVSPAIYRKGTTRANKNVVAWGGWAALDIDSHPFRTVDEIRDYMVANHSEKAHVCYSTASSSMEKPKFRLVFPLTEWIEDPRKIQMFWLSLNKEFADIADKQTKDQSRMYFIPARYSESNNNFFWSIDGDFLNPDSMIVKHRTEASFGNTEGSSFLDMLPERMREEIAAHRERQLKANGRRYSWTGYRDCPFVRDESVRTYKEIVFSHSEGRYRGLYQLMVSIANGAIARGYPITASEIKDLVLEIDTDTDGYYKNRKIDKESERAILWVYSKSGATS